mmetsp:Transcript_433/g.1405  ORF Transcript_433/g.1405 Transcript_433/m.1405 type:complete len:214 (+) Transcript_433:239-880(+)
MSLSSRFRTILRTSDWVTSPVELRRCLLLFISSSILDILSSRSWMSFAPIFFCQSSASCFSSAPFASPMLVMTRRFPLKTSCTSSSTLVAVFSVPTLCVCTSAASRSTSPRRAATRSSSATCSATAPRQRFRSSLAASRASVRLLESLGSKQSRHCTTRIASMSKPSLSALPRSFSSASFLLAPWSAASFSERSSRLASVGRMCLSMMRAIFW